MENPCAAKKAKTGDNDNLRNLMETLLRPTTSAPHDDLRVDTSGAEDPRETPTAPCNSEGTATSKGHRFHRREVPRGLREDGLLETLLEMQRSTGDNLLRLLFADFSSSPSSSAAPNLAASLAKSFVLLRLVIAQEVKRKERRNSTVLKNTSTQPPVLVETSTASPSPPTAPQKTTPSRSVGAAPSDPSFEGPAPQGPLPFGGSRSFRAFWTSDSRQLKPPSSTKSLRHATPPVFAVPRRSVHERSPQCGGHRGNGGRLVVPTAENAGEGFERWRAMALSLRTPHKRSPPPQPIYANWGEVLREMSPAGLAVPGIYAHEESTSF